MAEPVDPNGARDERAANRAAHNAPADDAANEYATKIESEHDAEEEAQGDDEAAQPRLAACGPTGCFFCPAEYRPAALVQWYTRCE